MCNLYRAKGSTAEIAQLFGAAQSGVGNALAEVYPGYPGLVVAEGELRSMAWGFPLVLTGKNGQPLKPKPVNNARSDKLDSFMWRDSFAKRRCLIPVSEYAEAEGEKGAMTRTWLSVVDQPVFAAAGIWRVSDEWGLVYSMVMTEACKQVQGVHTRMPVILRPTDWDRWSSAPADTARQLCVPYVGAMAVNRTSDPWMRR